MCAHQGGGCRFWRFILRSSISIELKSGWCICVQGGGGAGKSAPLLKCTLLDNSALLRAPKHFNQHMRLSKVPLLSHSCHHPSVLLLPPPLPLLLLLRCCCWQLVKIPW
jgi:hypothetical protein